MNNLTDRLNALAGHFNVPKYADFARKTGLSHQSASNYLKGKQKPDADKLSIIIQSFDNVDANWLLTGEGHMIKEKGINTSELTDYKILETIEFIEKNLDRFLEKEQFTRLINRLQTSNTSMNVEEEIRKIKERLNKLSADSN
ncbi:helix-turn-helix domain-containing protein [Spongiimicrobium salis]|uniref:helix-turn-helix domain-containing protein n=1 Tax=Spongiimicrobium salis TaxID=1667022 RepID=UPI00374CF130